jgi:hypothetical protein
MPKFMITVAANVRAYGCMMVEAEDEEAAWVRAKEAVADYNHSPEMQDVLFDPAYDSLSDFEVLEDCGIDELDRVPPDEDRVPDPGSNDPDCIHEWAFTGEAYGGDQPGEGRAYCVKCGADGDA